MKRLEIIELRITGKDHEKIESYFKELKKEFTDKNVQNIKIFSKLNLETDFSIHILHNTDEAGSLKSKPGQHLVSALKEFGLVNQSIWVQMKHD